MEILNITDKWQQLSTLTNLTGAESYLIQNNDKIDIVFTKANSKPEDDAKVPEIRLYGGGQIIDGILESDFSLLYVKIADQQTEKQTKQVIIWGW